MLVRPAFAFACFSFCILVLELSVEKRVRAPAVTCRDRCSSLDALEISAGDLASIYRVQFPVLQQNERVWRYDQHGRIVPTSSTVRGSSAVNLLELAATLKEQAGFEAGAEYHPDGSNTQELRKQRIRLNRKEADVLGVSDRCTMADLLAETEVRWSDEDHPEGRPVRLVGLRYTDPGLEPRLERVYPTPWTRCDREADYRQAWAEFERRLGQEDAGGDGAVIPSVVARQARETILDYLRTTFGLADVEFADALFAFLASEEGLFKGPYLDVRLPFKKAAENERIPLEIQPRVRALQAPAQGVPAAVLTRRSPTAAYAGDNWHRVRKDGVLPLSGAGPLLA